MISANDLRKGVTFVYDNDVYQVAQKMLPLTQMISLRML